MGLVRDFVKQTINFIPAKHNITTVMSDNEQPKLQVALYFFLTSLFERRRITSLTQAMGFTPVKPFYHASRTKDGAPAKAVSIDSFTSLARSHASSPAVFLAKS